jgi:serine/threonine protein kinase
MTSVAGDLAAALEGRYSIERELGRGGMATVYLAQDLKLGRPVALKVLRPVLAAALGTERFLREIEISTRLNHPHILPVHDSGDAGGYLYYAMPYVEGESLRRKLEHEGQLPVPEVIAIVSAVASALTYAHQQGIVHRDIKPENILLAKNSEGGAPYPLVADFGIARALDVAGGERLTETGLALGTPAYMSPEQAAGDRIDGRSDIYALGCVAYEMLAGTPPFTGPTPQAILARQAVDPVPPLHTLRSTVPWSVEHAIQRALAKVPADRFATAAQFAAALSAKSRPADVLRRPAVRRRILLGLGAVGLLVAGGFSIMKLRGSVAASVVASASSIAVLPFDAPPEDSGLGRLGRDLATTVSASLDGVGEIQTIGRPQITQAIEATPDDSPSDLVTLGRKLGARRIIRGTLVRSGPHIRADLGLYDTETRSPLAQGITITAHPDSLGALTDSVVLALLPQVWQQGQTPSPSLAAVTTRSLPALRAFLEGERLLEKDRLKLASLAYQSAIAADSTFWLAYYRYVVAQRWDEREPEPELIQALSQNHHKFPEPERLVVQAWSPPIWDSFPAETGVYQEVTRRFPDYWPGWFFLGDQLYHTGPLLGHSLAESEAAFQQAVALNPRLKAGWNHLLGISDRKDPAASDRIHARLRQLIDPDLSGREAEADSVSRRRDRFKTLVAQSGGVTDPRASPLADSMARDWVSHEVTHPNRRIAAWALLWWGWPVAQIDWNRRVLRLTPRYPANLFRAMAWAWTERGGWDSALTNIRKADQAEPHPADPNPPTVVDEYAMTVLGAWLGALREEEANQRRPPARAYVANLEPGARRRERAGALAWLDGLLAFSRRDQAALDNARQEVRRSGHPHANVIEQSLAAFGRALAGDRSGAGRALAKLEERWAGPHGFDEFTTPDIGVHRIAAANWLLEAGDTAQASRLLIWHEAAIGGWEWSFTYALTPLAYLMLARIEESRGNVRLARTYYHQFLRRYDSPMTNQRHLVDEARAGLARLSGNDPVETR